MYLALLLIQELELKGTRKTGKRWLTCFASSTSPYVVQMDKPA
jgi:hypothetical protein